MLILEHDIRWQHIWWQLSLDDTSPFIDELWVPLSDRDAFLREFRKLARSWLDKEEWYLSNPSMVSYNAFFWFEESFGPDHLNRLVNWGDKVFVHQGSDRLSEWIWETLVATTNKNREHKKSLPTWIAQLFSALQVEKLESKNRFQEKLRAHFETSLSDWDRAALSLRNVTRDSVKTTLSSTVTRNIFVQTWARLSAGLESAKLAELYEVGKDLASECSLDGQGYSFPNSWKFEMLPFISR
jgi:hypothetical protein